MPFIPRLKSLGFSGIAYKVYDVKEKNKVFPALLAKRDIFTRLIRGSE
jgi:hypothetical protein